MASSSLGRSFGRGFFFNSGGTLGQASGEHTLAPPRCSHYSGVCGGDVYIHRLYSLHVCRQKKRLCVCNVGSDVRQLLSMSRSALLDGHPSDSKNTVGGLVGWRRGGERLQLSPLEFHKLSHLSWNTRRGASCATVTFAVLFGPPGRALCGRPVSGSELVASVWTLGGLKGLGSFLSLLAVFG